MGQVITTVRPQIAAFTRLSREDDKTGTDPELGTAQPQLVHLYYLWYL